jgi:hypothetical protein
MTFKEEKKNLIKRFEVNKKTKVSYIISTILNIINRWDNIRIYVFNKNNIGGKNNEKQKN